MCRYHSGLESLALRGQPFVEARAELVAANGVLLSLALRGQPFVEARAELVAANGVLLSLALRGQPFVEAPRTRPRS